jgi:hypothetical protein
MVYNVVSQGDYRRHADQGKVAGLSLSGLQVKAAPAPFDKLRVNGRVFPFVVSLSNHWFREGKLGQVYSGYQLPRG